MQVSFGYVQVYTVDPYGRSGGLTLFCMDDHAVFDIICGQHMTDTEFTFERHIIYMTFIYGDPV